MDHAIIHPRFPKRRVIVRHDGVPGTPSTLLASGRVVPKSGRSAYVVKDDEGQAVTVEIIDGSFGPPRVLVGGEEAELDVALPWFAWLFAAIPFGLVVIGGLLGGLCGGAGGTLVLALFRTERSMPLKIAGALFLIAASLGGYFVLVVALQLWLAG